MAEELCEIKAQIAIIPETKCELCEENEIQFKCFTCEENQYMCQQCKKIHLKTKATRSHKITSVRGSDQQQQQYGRQEADDAKCSTHPGEDIQMYCKHCDLPVCYECIESGSHLNHKLTRLENVIDSKHEELSQIITEADQKLSEFEKSIKSIKKMSKDHSDDNAKCVARIKSRNAELKVKLDQITQDAIVKIQSKEKQDQEKLKHKQNGIEKNIAGLKELINQSKDKLEHRNLELVITVRDVRQRLQQYQPCDPPGPLNPPVFVSTDVDIQKLEAVFGYLDLDVKKKPDKDKKTSTMMPTNPKPVIDVKVITAFKISNKTLVAAVSDKQAWLAWGGSKDVTLVTTEGHTVQTVQTDFAIFDLAVTKSGDLLVTECDGYKVKKMCSGSSFIDLYVDKHRFNTRGITMTDDDNIVVCLYKSKSKEGKLVTLSPSGQLLDTIQYNRDGKTSLFDGPCYISCNRNGDLVVMQGYKSVVVVDSTGCMRFTYKGQVQGLKKPFNPWYTVTDQYSHIIISDYDNSAIHILDKDGKLLQYIMTNGLGVQKPGGLSIDKTGRLWLCSSYTSDKVVILKYV